MMAARATARRVERLWAGTVARVAVCAMTVLVIAACSTSRPGSWLGPNTATTSAALAPPAVKSVTWLATTTLSRTPTGVMQHFGGISGMDWDPASGTWFLLSDDRSEHAPARFYTARIGISAHGFSSVTIDSVVHMKQADGSLYPGPGQGGDVPDGEALRVDPRNGHLVWTSEGDRRIGLDPWIRRMGRGGELIGQLALPKNLAVHPDQELGSRHNLSLEGLAYTPDGGSYWLAMEAPLYEDGPVPTVDRGAFVRFTRQPVDSPRYAQFAYPVDAIPAPGVAGRRLSDNGVSEILALDRDRLLVVERSGREIGDRLFEFSVRLYEASVDGATDVADVPALREGRFKPMTKRLVLDLNKAGIGRIDNIEAAAWGPRLPDGRRTLILASDDNFAPNQVNQLMIFVIEPY
ncbi:MAG TPA: esterase-like activity of phytase family protein [Burkholderiaceae bacterium]